ncbi:MAG TPA: hybrid sensor histidine kinase/response regulator [Polyangiales bacterium]|nr:hybrid sensor histidine kinase/response regulator [Polyangiales bacterium]
MEPTEPASPTILVVDDNAPNRQLAQATLEDEGYRVLLAVDGAAAVSMFEREKPDCILLDVRMPVLDGPAACERIRALPGGHDTPVVFLTAQRDVDTFDRALRAGGDDFLTKPVQPSELLLRVQAALKLRKVKAELRDHYDLVRKQRDALMRLQLQKERMSQFLVHDLKNPLGTLDLCAQMLLRDAELSTRSRATVQRMRDEVRTLLHMLLNLLDISRSDEGGLVARKEPIALQGMFDQVVRDFDLKAQAAKLTIAADATSTAVAGDSSLLLRVLENIVENAVRHAPEHSRVQLSASVKNDLVEIRVADQGVGIAPELRERIFEPFVQLEHGDRTIQRNGRGLGLTFCKVAVEAHGGRIWIEDANPGAAICLTVPLSGETPH